MENLVVFSKKKLTLDKVLSDAKIVVEDEIKNVLSVSAKASCSCPEFSGSLVDVRGKLFVSAIFENVQGELCEAGTVVDFSQKQQVNFELTDAVCVNNEIVENFSFLGNEIMCSVRHNIEIFGNYKYIVPSFDESKDELVCKKQELNMLGFVGAFEDSFAVADESETNISGIQILRAEADLVKVTASALVDKVVIEGKIFAEIVYKDTDGLGKMQKDFEFKQEIEAQGTLPSQKVWAVVSVKNATITPEEKEDKTNIVCVFDLYSKCYTYEEVSASVVGDMFSLSSEIKTTEAFAIVKSFAKSVQEEQTISNLTNVTDIENFDDVVSVFGAKFDVLNIVQKENSAVIDGVICADALIMADGKYQVLKIRENSAFEIEKSAQDILGKVKVVAGVMSHKVKAGKELETLFKVDINAEFENETEFSFIENFELLKQKESQEECIRVYITKKGETLFDIAKVLSVKPEVIQKQNEIQTCFDEGEKIYVYSQVNLL